MKKHVAVRPSVHAHQHAAVAASTDMNRARALVVAHALSHRAMEVQRMARLRSVERTVIGLQRIVEIVKTTKKRSGIVRVVATGTIAREIDRRIEIEMSAAAGTQTLLSAPLEDTLDIIAAQLSTTEVAQVTHLRAHEGVQTPNHRPQTVTADVIEGRGLQPEVAVRKMMTWPHIPTFRSAIRIRARKALALHRYQPRVNFSGTASNGCLVSDKRRTLIQCRKT